MTAHVYAYQLHHGIIPAPWAGQVVIRHRCDETSCQNWDDLLIGTQPDNVRDYRARRGREDGPLADHRGARGRAVAIRDAIMTAPRTAPAPRKPSKARSTQASRHARNASSEGVGSADPGNNPGSAPAARITLKRPMLTWSHWA